MSIQLWIIVDALDLLISEKLSPCQDKISLSFDFIAVFSHNIYFDGILWSYESF